MGLALAAIAFAPAPAHASPAPLDVTPPTTPTGATFRVEGSTWSVVWNPSTDDTAVVGYEIFGKLGTGWTTTNTGFVLGNRPPSSYSVYAIRALDAAGNASPAALVMVGPGDISAPEAPANLRVSGPAQGYLSVGWDVSWDDVVVLGYEVYLNDTLVRRVGNTRAYVPFSGCGIYKVGVRAFDVMGRFSPISELSLAIDPPPQGTVM
jgi:hypothetical protein